MTAPALEGIIAAKDDGRRLVLGPVLTPGMPDAVGDELTADRVADLAHGYLASFRAIDADHDLVARDATPVESWLLDEPRVMRAADGRRLSLPEGTWMMGVRVDDDATWQRVRAGELAGFSIMGVPASAVEAAASDDVAAKALPEQVSRVTIAELEELTDGDWVVPMVSLVAEPSFPAARFVTVKAAPLRDRIARALGVEDGGPGDLAAGDLRALRTVKAGRRISDRRLSALEAARASLDDVVAALDGVIAEGRDERAAVSAAADPTLEEDPAMPQIDADALAAAVKGALDEELEPLRRKLGELEATLDAADESVAAKDDAGEDAGAEDGDEEAGEEAGEGGEEADADDGPAVDELVAKALEPLSAELATVKDQLARAQTRAGSGQLVVDDAAAKDAAPARHDLGRDALGRRRRRS